MQICCCFSTIQAFTLPGSGYFGAAIVSIFTQIGQKAISHQDVSYKSKALEKWEHPDIAVSELNIEW